MKETSSSSLSSSSHVFAAGGQSVIKQLHREINALLKQPLDQIEVIPNESDIMCLQAIIAGDESTPYFGGRFLLKLVFSEDYPRVPPKGFFVTTIFHPNVAPGSGEICISTLQKDWNPELGLPHLLLTIKCLLMVPNPESALNEEAGKLLLEDYQTYYQRAALMTKMHALPAPPLSKSPSSKRRDAARDAAPIDQNDTNCQIPNSASNNLLAEMRKKLKRL